MTNWTDIHKDFSGHWGDETYQQIWEQANITKEEAKEWIAVGFKPYNWKFVSWLRTNDYIPELVKNNLEQLRSDYENLKVNNSQTWLEQVYTNHNIKKLHIWNKNLKGELNFSQYQQLESLCCSENKLTNIILPTSLKALELSDNNFNQNLSFLVPCVNLETLYLKNNSFIYLFFILGNIF